MAQVLVGTSGYQYRHWRGVLYPPGLGTGRWLGRYASAFHTLELNTTFYRLTTALAAERWREATPPGFVFAAKGSRYITHMKKLKDPAEAVARFFASLRPLRPKLAVVLWQLPPRFDVDALPRLDAFLAVLPRGVRHAVEFREPSWYLPETCAVLDTHGAAFCEHDLVPLSPPRLTGGFRYLRFHGSGAKYGGRYGPGALAPVARDLLRTRRRGMDAYVYFNNDIGAHAVHDALALRRALGEAMCLDTLQPDGQKPEATP
ncbi:MAG TPA: DUF72 domain-containing protein [Myxococcaceae bacterium]|nr:DUF72 domain-containing protein [Myxococcaceae bacterium]